MRPFPQGQRDRRRKGWVNRARRWVYGVLLSYLASRNAFGMAPLGPPVAAPFVPPAAAELDALPRERLPAVHIDARRPAVDDTDERGTFMRFAVPVAVDIATERAGRWEQLPSGDWRWRAVIEGIGARSLNLRFDVFRLPAQAYVVVYAPSGAVLHGPYTAASAVGGELWTPLVPGEQAVVEAVVPDAGRAELALRIAQVGYGYQGLERVPAKVGGGCHMDVACDAAAPWRDEARSVVRLTVDGIYVCSGTLVNNTALDGAPYVLTANHCVPDAARAASVVAYWNYEHAACSDAKQGSLAQAQSGAVFVAGHAASDFTLIRLAHAPHPDWNARYAGWDNRPAVPAGVVSIHHPSGQEKGISFEADPPRVTSAFADDAEEEGAFLMVEHWDSGATAPGSSGGGLWNAEHRLVGQLSGGYSSCLASGSDWFGRLSSAWDGAAGTDASARLRPHLDPLGTGAPTLDAADARALGGAGEPAAVPASGSGGSGGGALSPGLWLVAIARLLFGLGAAGRLWLAARTARPTYAAPGGGIP